MKIALVSAELPPALDGIGDYTARLACGLSSAADIIVYTGSAQKPSPMSSVLIRQPFSSTSRSSVYGIIRAVEEDRPDWVVLQFNQFSYGRWGLNPYLPLVMRAIKRNPAVRLAVMFHETFVGVTSWKFATFRLWQQWQFWALGRSADLVLFSVEPWVGKYSSWFPGVSASHIPVGSNITRCEVTREQARRTLGIADKTLVVGLFGSSSTLMPEWVRRSALAVKERNNDLLFLFIGHTRPNLLDGVSDAGVLAEGRLSEVDISTRLAAMDVYMAPLSDGLSTRRGTVIAALQHGVPVVTTNGYSTSDLLRRENGRAYLMANADDQNAFIRHVIRLSEDVELRAQIGAGGEALFERVFTWDAVAAAYLDKLGVRRESECIA